MTIGDLLAHTAGLWSSAAEWNDWVGPNLGALRGYTRESDYAAEDAALRARYPEFAADLGRTRTWLAANRACPARSTSRAATTCAWRTRSSSRSA